MPENFEFNRTQFKPEPAFCTCDLIEAACDVNCCCDKDCFKADDFKAFSDCKPIQPNNYDHKFCFNSQIYVQNNTQFIMTEVGTYYECTFYMISYSKEL